MTYAPSIAIVEWTIAFGFTFYMLTFFWDLRMSKGVHKGELSRERLLAMQQRGQGVGAIREVNETGATGVPQPLYRHADAVAVTNGHAAANGHSSPTYPQQVAVA